jgi:thymidine phosphorylase
MKTEPEARHLASELTRVGEALGRTVVCVMSDMDQPLGMAVGNALEVREAIETLRSEGPAALTELCLVLGGKMLVMAGVASDEAAGRSRCALAIADGSALDAFRRWIAAQGGDPQIANDPSLLRLSTAVREVRATTPGFVAGFDSEGVGRAAMLLGAGRARKDDVIDLGAGLQLAVRVGDRIETGSLLCTMYAASEELLDAGEERFRDSVRVSASRVDPPPLLHEL